MLNPGFSPEVEAEFGSRYAVPDALSEAIVGANADFAAGPELRTQPVYGDELWFRLRELGVAGLPWADLKVLDACCGSGFLSYHLRERAPVGALTMVDVSPAEVAAAEELVAGSGDVTTVCGDLAANDLDREFDVVIGNSFLHHFPDVPALLRTALGLLRPGGVFISLHEPAPAALAWESGDPRHVAAFFLMRRYYMRRMRHPGPRPVREGTTDVWIFDIAELRDLLGDVGFDDIRVVPRYLLRPFVVGALRLHLDADKPRLSRFESRLLRASVRADAMLRRVLPARAFGGLSFVARRPA